MSVGEGPIGENIYIVRPRHFFGGVGGAVGENAAMPRSVYVTAWRAGADRPGQPATKWFDTNEIKQNN